MKALCVELASLRPVLGRVVWSYVIEAVTEPDGQRRLSVVSVLRASEQLEELSEAVVRAYESCEMLVGAQIIRAVGEALTMGVEHGDR